MLEKATVVPDASRGAPDPYAQPEIPLPAAVPSRLMLMSVMVDSERSRRTTSNDPLVSGVATVSVAPVA